MKVKASELQAGDVLYTPDFWGTVERVFITSPKTHVMIHFVFGKPEWLEKDQMVEIDRPAAYTPRVTTSSPVRRHSIAEEEESWEEEDLDRLADEVFA